MTGASTLGWLLAVGERERRRRAANVIAADHIRALGPIGEIHLGAVQVVERRDTWLLCIRRGHGRHGRVARNVGVVVGRRKVHGLVRARQRVPHICTGENVNRMGGKSCQLFTMHRKVQVGLVLSLRE